MTDALVLIPTYNERENLPVLVARRAGARRTRECSSIDDSSPDGTGEVADALAREHPGRVARDAPHGPARPGPVVPRRLPRSAVDDRRRRRLPDGRRPVARPAVPAGADRGGRARRGPGDRLALPAGRQRRELAAAPHDAQRVRQHATSASVTGLRVRDCTSGYRCWRREALAALPLDAFVSDGYSFLVEMLFLAAARGPAHRRSADHLRRAAPGRVEAVVAASCSSR